MLVDHLAAESRAEIECLAGADHRVRERERLGGGEPVEVDGHAPRGHLVVGHLVARIAEHELGELVRAELLAVALALDQLGGTDHRAFSATKTLHRRVTASPSGRSGTFVASCLCAIDDAT